MKKSLFAYLVILFVAVQGMQAQQTPLYTQYMMNGFLLNPAIAGSEGYTSVSVVAREQWVGFPGSPRTQSVSAQTRLLPDSWLLSLFGKKKGRSRYRRSNQSKVGLGIYVLNDRNGLVDKTGFEMAYAYHIFMKQQQLSFGLALSGYQVRIDKSLLNDGSGNTVGSTQDWTNYNNLSMFIPDATMGVWYSSPILYGGLSVSNLFQSYLKFSNEFRDKFKQSRTFYISGGAKLEMNRNWMFEPSTLIKYSQSGALQFDLGGRFYYNEDYWAGMAYRSGADKGQFGFTSSALSFMFGVRVDRFYFGYAFDYSLNDLMPSTFGSHEFMLSYKFGDNTRRYRWLNRY